MATIEFHLHQQGNDPGEGGVECNHYKSNSEGEEEVETLVTCERFMEVVNTACSWGREWEEMGQWVLSMRQAVNERRHYYMAHKTGRCRAPTQENRQWYTRICSLGLPDAEGVQTGLPITCVCDLSLATLTPYTQIHSI